MNKELSIGRFGSHGADTNSWQSLYRICKLSSNYLYKKKNLFRFLVTSKILNWIYKDCIKYQGYILDCVSFWKDIKLVTMTKLHGPAWTIQYFVSHLDSVKGEKFTGELLKTCLRFYLAASSLCSWTFISFCFLHVHPIHAATPSYYVCVVTSASFSSVTLCKCSGIARPFLLEVDYPQVKPATDGLTIYKVTAFPSFT